MLQGAGELVRRRGETFGDSQQSMAVAIRDGSTQYRKRNEVALLSALR